MTLEALIAAVVAVWVIGFAIAYGYYYNKVQKNFRLTGQRPNQGRIFRDACGIACVVGIICRLAETKAEAAANNANIKSDGGGRGEGDVEAQQPVMVQPMPIYQPQGMEWTPMHSAATDGVQG